MQTPADAPTTDQPKTAPLSMSRFTADVFRPLIGQIFRFADGSERLVELELLEVTSSSVRPPGTGFRTPFTLLFALRSAEPAKRELMQIHDDAFEAGWWFVNRVTIASKEPHTAYYQAVFA